MNLSRFTLLLSLGILLISCKNEKDNQYLGSDEVISFVDQYIGTGGHGHTFMGVAAPFGAVQVGPANINKGWDWCSGYHYSDSVVVGFSHLHLNGTGCSDTGDLIFMPYTGIAKVDKGTQENPTSGYGSHYSHSDEVFSPGYYSVLLKDYDVKVELTASDRVAFHKYTFPKTNEGKFVMINLKEANGDDRPVETFMEQIDEKTIAGYRFSKGWSKDQRIFFTAVFSQPVDLVLYDDTVTVEGKTLKAVNVKGNILVKPDVSELMVKVGISPVSVENAKLNIDEEVNHWNFDELVAQTNSKWKDELDNVLISSKDTTAAKIFYTSLYHAFLQPIMFNDFNHDYRGTDKAVYHKASFTNYTVFSLWDTYRAAHPLYTILQPQRVPDFMKSMLAIHEQQGMLPVWHLYGSDTQEMIGIHSVTVLADAILKDVPGFDYETAYNAMKTSMLSNYKGLKYVREQKYIPSDLEGESVAKGLEYAISDWALAQVAKKLGKKDDYKLFSERAQYYRNYWDSETAFFRGKTVNGQWNTPFNPSRSTHRADDYCEGNAWQYTWMVPHDVEGLVSLFGSEERFAQKLDSLFNIKDSLGEEASPDISGLIGQYAHGNEPGHHIVYLYPFVGQQWKTAEKVRFIMSEMYHAKPDGIIGNEDCGQMSSWYIFSAFGFYPVNPASGVYVFGSPLFDRVKISLPQNRSFEIIAENNSDKNIYIQSVELNGVNYTKTYISHADIMAGGKLKFVMGNTPNYNFGKDINDRPKSNIF